MAINARDRFAELPADERKAIRKRADELYAEEMTLAEIRKALQQSQGKLAEKLGIKQAALSRFERRGDMYVSTLRDTIEAMGGEFKIVAQFPDRPAVSISMFDSQKPATKSKRVEPGRRRRPVVSAESVLRKLGASGVMTPSERAPKKLCAQKSLPTIEVIVKKKVPRGTGRS